MPVTGRQLYAGPSCRKATQRLKDKIELEIKAKPQN